MGSDRSSNSQYSDSGAQLWPGAYGSTGSPGTPSAGDAPPAGPVVGTVTVSIPGKSSQVAQSVLDVTAFDTSSSSSDNCIVQNPMAPMPAGRYLSTGAGEGSAGHHPHPNGHGAGG